MAYQIALPSNSAMVIGFLAIPAAFAGVSHVLSEGRAKLKCHTKGAKA
jgi:hypothetical protein